TPHSRIAACDQRLATRQTAGAAIGCFTMVRLPRHLARQAGPGLRLFFEGWLGIAAARIDQPMRRCALEYLFILVHDRHRYIQREGCGVLALGPGALLSRAVGSPP